MPTFRYLCQAVDISHWEKPDPPIELLFEAPDWTSAETLANENGVSIRSRPAVDYIHYEVLERGEVGPSNEFKTMEVRILFHMNACRDFRCPGLTATEQNRNFLALKKHAVGHG